MYNGYYDLENWEEPKGEIPLPEYGEPGFINELLIGFGTFAICFVPLFLCVAFGVC